MEVFMFKKVILTGICCLALVPATPARASFCSHAVTFVAGAATGVAGLLGLGLLVITYQKYAPFVQYTRSLEQLKQKYGALYQAVCAENVEQVQELIKYQYDYSMQQAVKDLCFDKVSLEMDIFHVQAAIEAHKFPELSNQAISILEWQKLLEAQNELLAQLLAIQTYLAPMLFLKPISHQDDTTNIVPQCTDEDNALQAA